MKNQRAIHPFMVALFPVVSLYSSNIKNTRIAELLLPAAVSLGLALVLYGFFLLLFRDGKKSAIIASVSLFSFFSYGHIKNALAQFITVIVPVIDRILFLVIGTLLAVICIVLVRSKKKMIIITRLFNVLSSALLVAPIAIILTTNPFSGVDVSMLLNGDEDSPDVKNIRAASKQPPIFYIIVDGYSRSDVLKKYCDFDNSGFLKKLKQYNFFINDQAYSNYDETKLSVSSTLNLDYHNTLLPMLGLQDINKDYLFALFAESRVSHYLGNRGYKTVSFATGYSFTDSVKTDQYEKPQWAFTEFQKVLISTTAILPVIDRWYQVGADVQRRRILYIFKRLPELAAEQKPYFIFAHIVAPHHPFVFGENGEPLAGKQPWALIKDSSIRIEEYRAGYRAQAIFITKKLDQLIENILHKTNGNAVIIIQADHGGLRCEPDDGDTIAWLKKRTAILSAIYVPDYIAAELYQGMTPVNTFRVLFNALFDDDYTLLHDTIYYDELEEPVLVTDIDTGI